MITRHEIEKIQDDTINFYIPDNAVFFDIETTGFSAKSASLYLIGCAFKRAHEWEFLQWMAEAPTPLEQTEILNAFLSYLHADTLLISYNGTTFDLPFLRAKCRQLNISWDTTNLNHWDLYMDVRHLKNLLALPDLKLKTVESFLGIRREDLYSGGDLIPVYKEYARYQSEHFKQLLLLHNFEDIKDMLHILPILSYKFMNDGQFTLKGLNLQNNHALVTLKHSCTFPVSLNKELPGPFVSGLNLPVMKLYLDLNQIELALPLFHGELKFFYEHYKDYFYLPAEDYAIHKSVAVFVDKDFRQKATPENCYIKKTDTFLPQYGKVIMPAFKDAYKADLSWVPYSNELSENPLILRYILMLLRRFF